MIVTSKTTTTSTSTMLGMLMLAALANILPIPIIVVDSKQPAPVATVTGSAQNLAFYQHVSKSYADEGCLKSWGAFPSLEDPTLAPPRFNSNPTGGMACMCGMLHSLGSSALLEYSKQDEIIEVIENGVIVSTEIKESPMTIANTLNLESKCVNGEAEGTSYPCNNVDLIAHLPLNIFNTTNTNSTPKIFNDVWGWTSEATGREFVITGVEEGTYFVEITDGHPIILGFLPSNSALDKFTIWSDMKVIGNYAYIVAQQGKHGLQVFDLTRLLEIDPKNDCISNQYCFELEADAIYTGTEETQLSKTHNIAANAETNMLYLVGVSKSCGQGMHIVDVSNPLEPTFVACFSADGYTHDAQCVTYRGADTEYYESEICFCYNEDTVTIVDVTDKGNMTILSRTSYDEDSYTHQGWLSTDQSYVVFGDEYDEITNTDITNTRTLILDVTSLTSPTNFQEYFGPTEAVDHNQYIVEATAPGQDYNNELYGNTDLVYQANYAAGLRIQQVIDYDTGFMEEVGFFDTYPISDAAVLEGAFSVYPYFKSGLVAITSMREGLFIVRPNLTTSLVDPLSTTVAPTQSTSPTASPTPLTQPCLVIEGGWSDTEYGMTCNAIPYAYIVNSPGLIVACFTEVNADGIRKQDACSECGKCIGPLTTNSPTNSATNSPTSTPTSTPTDSPTNAPTNVPTSVPTNVPTNVPTSAPTPICKDRPAMFKMKDEKTKHTCDWAEEKNRKKRCNKKVKKGAYKVYNEKGRKVDAKKVKHLCPLSCKLCNN